MNYDTELATRLITELEISDNAQAILASQLLRELTLTVEQLTILLCCPCSFAEGMPDTCDWKWTNEQLACTRCGQLAADWRVRAGTVLETLRQPIAEPAAAPLVIEGDGRFGRPKNDGNSASAGSQRRCLGCGNTLSVLAKFCSSCGRTAQGETFCLGCNSPLSAGATFCSECGAKVA
jgi:hypothetical protein